MKKAAASTICICLICLLALPAAALTVQQVLDLRKAGVSDAVINRMIDNEITAATRGGVGRYTLRQSDGSSIIVYEAKSPQGVVRYDTDISESLAPRAAIILDAPPKAGGAAATDGGNYALHVASFRERARAETMAADLRSQGLQPRVVDVDLGDKGRWHRVMIGGFKTNAQADAEGRRLKKRGVVDSYVVLDR